MYYLNFIAICIPVFLSIVTFLFYYPLVVEYFDKKKSISYKNSNKHTFFILLILIVISTSLAFLIVRKVDYLFSWIGQLIVLIVFYKTIDIKFQKLKKYIKGENLEFDIQKNSNDLSEEFRANSNELRKSISENIKQSTSDLLSTSKETKGDIIQAIETNSEKILIHSNVIKEGLSTSIENVLSSNADLKVSLDNLKNEYEKTYIKDSILFIKKISKFDFDKLLVDSSIVLENENYELFKNLIIEKIQPISKINIIVPFKYQYTKNMLDKKRLMTFMNLFFDLENISNKDFKEEFNISKENFFNRIFLVNGKENKFKRPDFNNRYFST